MDFQKGWAGRWTVIKMRTMHSSLLHHRNHAVLMELGALPGGRSWSAQQLPPFSAFLATTFPLPLQTVAETPFRAVWLNCLVGIKKCLNSYSGEGLDGSSPCRLRGHLACLGSAGLQFIFLFLLFGAIWHSRNT